MPIAAIAAQVVVIARADEARAYVVPFRCRGAGPAGARPGPIRTTCDVYDVDGRPVQLLEERWRLADLWACPHRDLVRADPARPDEGTVTRLQSLASGRIAVPLSRARIRDWGRDSGRDAGDPPAARPKGRA